jgi:hypothetical protein
MSLPHELQKKFDKLEIKIKNLSKQNYTVSVGWFNAEMAKIAKIQEYGAHINVTQKMRIFMLKTYGINLFGKDTITIPPRPHMQETKNKFIDSWKKKLATLLKRNNYDLEKSLSTLSLIMVQDYKSVFADAKFKDLSSATLHIRQIKNIGGTQPLVASGEMQRQIDGKVFKR